MKKPKTAQRRHDLDWLRVIGVLLLIPFHGALIFVLDSNSIMYVKDKINSLALQNMAGFLHLWHMPLLFILAGSASYFALGVRSAGQYLRERFTRLLIPLIFGIATYIPLTTYIQRSKSISLADAYRGFFRIDFAQIDGVDGTFTPAHLWFILYLFIFSMIALPGFMALRSEKGKDIISKFVQAIPTSLSLILFGLPLTLAMTLNILGDKNPIYYFLIFFSGYLIASDERFQKGIDQILWGVLAFGLPAAVISIASYQVHPAGTIEWLIFGLVYEFSRWTLTIAALGLGQRFLKHNSSFLRYANQAAMPFYLLHMSFTVLTGYFVIQIDAPVGVKYPVIVLVATGLTLFAYELVRRWKVARWLFGMRIDK